MPLMTHISTGRWRFSSVFEQIAFFSVAESSVILYKEGLS